MPWHQGLSSDERNRRIEEDVERYIRLRAYDGQGLVVRAHAILLGAKGSIDQKRRGGRPRQGTGERNGISAHRLDHGRSDQDEGRGGEQGPQNDGDNHVWHGATPELRFNTRLDPTNVNAR